MTPHAYLRNVSRMRAPLHSGAEAPFCCAGVGITPAGCSTATAGDAAAAHHEATVRHVRYAATRLGQQPSTPYVVLQEHESCHLLFATSSEGWADGAAPLRANCYLHDTYMLQIRRVA